MVEHEMNSIAGGPSAKVLGWTLFFFGVVAVLLFLIGGLLFGGDGAFSGPVEIRPLVTFPLITGVGGYLATRIFCAIYNRAAARWGGIKLNLTEIHSPMNPRWKP